MYRILERELMDDAKQVAAYAGADFASSNQRFVDGLTHDFPAHLHTVIDVGCGPGDVVIRLARASRSARITAVDGSAPMLALAEEATRAAGLARRTALVRCLVQRLPFRDGAFDAVLSKDVLHHLAEPAHFWREIARVGRPGAAVYVMDLMRPATAADAWRIVDAAAASEDSILRSDFFNSLCAAFTVREVEEQIAASGLALDVVPATERHWLARGLLTSTS